MKRNDDVLERLAPLSGAPSRGYEELLRLRTKRQRVRKIGTIAVVAGLVVALVSVGLAIDDRSEKPANPPDGSRPGTFTGLVVQATGHDCGDHPYELVARDPSSGETITLVDVAKFFGSPGVVAWAGASADGRWFAFEGRPCDASSPTELWVTNGVDEPRQLTTTPYHMDVSDRWAWSPTGSRLAVLEGNQLILIDPATGDRTDLGKPAGDTGSLAWSPDGTQIAYSAVSPGTPNGDPTDGSLYAVSVEGGEHSLIAESVGEPPGGEEGSGIQWSPDSTRIAIVGGTDPAGTPTLYVMEADGSHRRTLAEGVFVAHTLGTPNIVWSPDGTRIAYATSPGDHSKVWSAPADGSSPVLVFGPTSPGLDPAGPVWSPDGTQIAFRYDQQDQRSYLIANADGSGDVSEIDELQYREWRGGRYFCECYG